MKIQCNVCEAAEASVLCCADEAALCWSCDQKVHAANKLATKHQRVPLSNSSSHTPPKCDICQETVGYFFCLEDRSLLCRKCDIAIHTANPLVALHQRFLLTGVKVGAGVIGPGPGPGKPRSLCNEKIPEPDAPVLPKRTTPVSASSVPCNKNLPVQTGVSGSSSSGKQPFAGGSAAGSIPQWQLDEFLGLGDFDQNFTFMDNGSSSKADYGKLGDSDCHPAMQAFDGEVDCGQNLGQAPDSFWAVPQISSPPTATGHQWPKDYQSVSESVVFVPDIVSSPLQHFHHHAHQSKSSKRRRNF